MDSIGKPIELKFTAFDGREVDLAQMKGKVVLVYFWEGRAEPQVKAAWAKYHDQGFEVIGINCYPDKERFDNYIRQNETTWPQYSDDNKKVAGNKIEIEFGIDGFQTSVPRG